MDDLAKTTACCSEIPVQFLHLKQDTKTQHLIGAEMKMYGKRMSTSEANNTKEHMSSERKAVFGK